MKCNDELVDGFSDGFIKLSEIAGTARAPDRLGKIMDAMLQDSISEGTDLGRDLFANTPEHLFYVKSPEEH